MKKVRTFVAMLVLIYIVMTMTCGFTYNSSIIAYAESAIHDTGATNDFPASSNYTFWESENELKCVSNAAVRYIINEQFEEIGEGELSKETMEEIKAIQEGIISFFQENYGVDVSEKLANQEVKVFTPEENTLRMGYFLLEHPNVVNISEKVIEDENFEKYFRNVYVRETLHMLGIPSDGNLRVLCEGFADAYADLILCYMGIESHTLPEYYEARTLAYQMIEVDTELPHLFFETKNFSVSDRISQRLSTVPQLYVKSDDYGRKLNGLLEVYTGGRLGIDEGWTMLPHFYQYEAQEIVMCYCKTFEPTHSQIDYIRNHYLLDNFESIEMIPVNVGEHVGYRIK